MAEFARSLHRATEWRPDYQGDFPIRSAGKNRTPPARSPGNRDLPASGLPRNKCCISCGAGRLRRRVLPSAEEVESPHAPTRSATFLQRRYAPRRGVATPRSNRLFALGHSTDRFEHLVTRRVLDKEAPVFITKMGQSRTPRPSPATPAPSPIVAPALRWFWAEPSLLQSGSLNCPEPVEGAQRWPRPQRQMRQNAA